MKIALLSDLHLSVHPMEPPRTGADVTVLAGDICRPEAAINWAKQLRQPALFVAGNHEFYGTDLMTTMTQLRAHADGSSVRVLERAEALCGNVRFLGCTLWSDYRLYRRADERELGLRQATELVRDFSHIQVAPDFAQKFTPALSQLLFDGSVAWLEQKFRERHDGPTVVITHFAPSRDSIHPRFSHSLLNACFVSDLKSRILRWQPQLWMHGHTHDSFDYRIGETRVIANPRGYVRNGVAENPSFDPELVVEVT